jgi:hypothetical protein
MSISVRRRIVLFGLSPDNLSFFIKARDLVVMTISLFRKRFDRRAVLTGKALYYAVHLKYASSEARKVAMFSLCLGTFFFASATTVSSFAVADIVSTGFRRALSCRADSRRTSPPG